MSARTGLRIFALVQFTPSPFTFDLSCLLLRAPDTLNSPSPFLPHHFFLACRACNIDFGRPFSNNTALSNQSLFQYEQTTLFSVIKAF